MKIFFKSRRVLLFIVAGVVLVGSFVAYQYQTLNTAHSTFENYYAFRGCQSLIDRADTYAHCRLVDGRVIKLVRIGGKWYLEGDGPGVW